MSDPLLSPSNLLFTRHDYGAYLGFCFTVGVSDIIVTHLARWIISGNSGTHTVGLFLWNSPYTSLGSVSIDTSIGTPGTFSYEILSSPVVLASTVTYVLASLEVNLGDYWYDDSVHTNPTVDINTTKSVYGPTPWSFNAVNVTYVPVNGLYYIGGLPSIGKSIFGYDSIFHAGGIIQT